MSEAGNRSHTPDDCRCRASCEVLPGTLKRCIRGQGHKERHVWIEALTRSDGFSQLMEWDAPDAMSPDVIASVAVHE